MHITVVPEVPALVEECAAHAARSIRRVLDEASSVRIVAATGSSQINFLKTLLKAPGIDWRRVELFHLDEYIGLGEDHPASFRRFLLDRLIEPAGIERVHLIDGLGNPQDVAGEMNEEIGRAPIDLLFCGIGENGHLAFNDPPADFVATAPYLVVELDEACRRQQVSEGWFKTIDDVPRTAISMSIQQILAAREIICIAHGARKAAAVASCFAGSVSPAAPASILQMHDNATIYMDPAAAAGLRREASAIQERN